MLGGATQISNALMNNGLDARDGIKTQFVSGYHHSNCMRNDHMLESRIW